MRKPPCGRPVRIWSSFKANLEEGHAPEEESVEIEGLGDTINFD